MSQTLLTCLNLVQVQFTCGRGQFVSVVKSVCKTQLGNQVQCTGAPLPRCVTLTLATQYSTVKYSTGALPCCVTLTLATVQYSTVQLPQVRAPPAVYH